MHSFVLLMLLFYLNLLGHLHVGSRAEESIRLPWERITVRFEEAGWISAAGFRSASTSSNDNVSAPRAGCAGSRMILLRPMTCHVESTRDHVFSFNIGKSSLARLRKTRHAKPCSFLLAFPRWSSFRCPLHQPTLPPPLDQCQCRLAWSTIPTICFGDTHS